MERLEPRRRLIVNADDFGLSSSINQAVIRAHSEGILTSASLMVNEPAAQEAIVMARDLPALGIGLHLTLVCGHSALPHERVPDLVNPAGDFGCRPVAAGWRYFFSRRLKSQLRDEIAAQFDKFQSTGLPLDHVNGHLHLHLHPVVLEILMDHATAWGIRHMRLTHDPFGLNLRIASGRWLYRSSHAAVHHILSRRARPRLRRHAIRHTAAVFGLLQNARVDERYILELLPRLAPGDSELYSHPSLDQFRHEFAALVSPRVKALIQEQNIELVRYRDL